MESAECRGRILGQREEEKKEREKKGGVRERIEREEEEIRGGRRRGIGKCKEDPETRGGRRKGAEEAPGPFLLVSDLAVEDDIQKFVEVKDGQLAALSGNDSLLAPVA